MRDDIAFLPKLKYDKDFFNVNIDKIKNDYKRQANIDRKKREQLLKFEE